MSYTISSVSAFEILDSRGNPTLEVEIMLENGLGSRSSVPSGASTGSREALELRDQDKGRFSGKGVLKALNNVNTELNNLLRGNDCRDQRRLDQLMVTFDGTSDKSRLGANSILGVSMALARLGSLSCNLPLYSYLGGSNAYLLPVPCMNVLNGGVHARGQGADFQEYMIAPWGASSFSESLRWGSEIYQSLRSVLLDSGYSVGVGDEGGFAPTVPSNKTPLELLMRGVERAGYKPGEDVVFCIDPASSEFYHDGKYHLKTEKRELTSEEMSNYYLDLIKNFPIVLLEDGLAEDDWSGWGILHKLLGDKVELVGDDIFVTNVEYISRGIREKIANSALIKLNQIGSVTETLDAVSLCHNNSWGTFISHRSGETVDSFISDLTVAVGAGHLKSGAPCRGERVEKYNQLMRIERHLGKTAVFAGKNAFIKSCKSII